MKWMPVFMATVLLFMTVINSASADIKLCRESTVNHTPRADVIHDNNAVVNVPDPIMLPVTIDMARRYHLDLPQGTNIESYIGMMEIYKDGRILYDGQDISGDIKDVCDSDDTDNFDIRLND